MKNMFRGFAKWNGIHFKHFIIPLYLQKSLGCLFFISTIYFFHLFDPSQEILYVSQALGDSDSKESVHNARNPALIPGLRRSPGGHHNPFQ